MILFSSKAFNIPIAYFAKVTLTERMDDPFLRLVEDCKLKAIDSRSVYGSEEDDNLALKTLSQIEITPEQRRESLASEILKRLGISSELELSNTRAQLLSKFLPDDVCPLGAQLPKDALLKAGAEENNSIKEGAQFFSTEDECQTKDNSGLSQGIPEPLDVNQLLDSVLETSYQFGRPSVSTGPDMSYKDIAHHCETLQTGKQQKLSDLMSVHLKQESLINCLSFQNPFDDTKQTGPILEQTDGTNPLKQPFDTLSPRCATEYQNHLQPFSLPTSSPYDNFLKAAGC
ncbi:hypothetical protein F3Y22_tig00110773pilonHSYRG00059 [Hibiscus syriacus]|uniref:Uncharacterized protein n=1 Tax=Hibiscus syriacus TaxID=106335 RepID=A0A6A2ZS90_HIBSY|nr:hypothetical protein F3Y22_tig00110773pilonHSYRG00059 [Hibiscus syriacus]